MDTPLFPRYFIEVTLEALCIEWTIVLGALLLDVSVLARTVEMVQKQGGVEEDVFTRIIRGMEDMYTWAESEWYACHIQLGDDQFYVMNALLFLGLCFLGGHFFF